HAHLALAGRAPPRGADAASGPLSGQRSRPAPPGPPSASAVRLFLLLLLFLAADAKGGHRPGLEPLGGDGLLAALAHAERAVVDAAQRPLDLLQEELLPVPEAKHHRLRVFAGGEVDLVR